MGIIMIESFPELLKVTTGKMARIPIPGPRRKRRKKKKVVRKKRVSFVITVSSR